MKRSKLLVSILHGLWKFLFWFLILLIAYIFTFEVFTENGKIGNFVSENHSSNGYHIPVTYNINIRNAIFNNFKTVNKKQHVNMNGRKYQSANLEYIDEMPEDISNGVKNIVSFHFEDEIEYYKTKDSNSHVKGYIIAKSDNLLINSLQILRVYLPIFALAMIFFLLKRAFYLLKKEITFSEKLYKNVKWLGIIIISNTLIALVLTYILGSYFGNISVETMIDNKTFGGGINLSMNPRLEFDFTLFFVGISLLVLTTLLKSGNELQQENDLTI